MKQSEINKLLNKSVKAAAKSLGWKSSGSSIFRETDLLIFYIGCVAHKKPENIAYLSGYKFKAFDELFCKIVQLEENINTALSFRARASWVAPCFYFTSTLESVGEWTEENAFSAVERIIKKTEVVTEKLESEIHNPDDNLRWLEKFYQEKLKENPNMPMTLSMEKLFTALLNKNFSLAQEIVRERIEKRDHGGKTFKNMTFYEGADLYLKKIGF